MSGLALATSRPATTDKHKLKDLADPARGLARDISKNVARILGALQIGDITRQRAEHIRSGLALIAGLDRSTRQLRVRAAGEMLLAAQLEAALRDYNHEVTKLLPSIEGLASDALALAALSEMVAELGDAGHDLRDLKGRMDAAVQLVAEIQSADGAIRYLSGRLAIDKAPLAEVAAPVSERHPLDQNASDLLNRVIYLEAAADDCIVILERLKDASEALITDQPAAAQTFAGSQVSQKDLAAAAERIKAILDRVEDDMAVHAGKNTDLLRLLDQAASPAPSPETDGELEMGRYVGLNFACADLGADDTDLGDDLSALLSKIERLYTMGQEREVHRAFSRACGLETPEDPDATEDGLF